MATAKKVTVKKRTTNAEPTATANGTNLVGVPSDEVLDIASDPWNGIVTLTQSGGVYLVTNDRNGHSVWHKTLEEAKADFVEQVNGVR